MASLPADSALLSAKSGRVKAARRLATRAFRAEQGLFLAEGPQAVREALTVPDCVVEVFAVVAAGAAHPDILHAADRLGLPWRLVDDGEDLHHAVRNGQCLTNRLRALGEKQPLLCPESTCGEPPCRLHPATLCREQG